MRIVVFPIWFARRGLARWVEGADAGKDFFNRDAQDAQDGQDLGVTGQIGGRACEPGARQGTSVGRGVLSVVGLVKVYGDAEKDLRLTFPLGRDAAVAHGEVHEADPFPDLAVALKSVVESP